jgi:uroporphyrinogen decarboxylase
MKKLTSLERVAKVLNLQEPDIIPHWELGIARNVIDVILPGASYRDFVEYMDIDAIVIFDKVGAWSYETVDAHKKISRDQWGALVRFTSEALGHPWEAAIKSEKDLESYVAPDPDEQWRYKYLKGIVKRFKGQRAIFAHVTDVFDIAKESLLGDEQYFEAMINNPSIVDRVNEIVLNYNLRYIKSCIEMGADFLLITGDYAMTQGPFVSPKHTARFLTPSLKKMVELAHGLNVPVIKHTDGNIWKIFDLIIETGIDGIHPIDPMAGMDLGEAKAKYGKKICLMGNVNCGSTLSWGTIEEVRQEVKDCIRKAGYGGGYICASSNSIHSGVKPENYVAMVKAIREYGRYPLKL